MTKQMNFMRIKQFLEVADIRLTVSAIL